MLKEGMSLVKDSFIYGNRKERFQTNTETVVRNYNLKRCNCNSHYSFVLRAVPLYLNYKLHCCHWSQCTGQMFVVVVVVLILHQ